MTIALSGGGTLFTGTAVQLQEHTKHESISVDDGAVHIDADQDHVIAIRHTRGDSKNILSATDIGTETYSMRVDSNGNVIAPDVKYDTSGKSLVQLSTDTGTATADLAAATAADAGSADNLIRRDQANGTAVNNLHVVARESGYTPTYPPPGLYFTQGFCDDSLDLIQHGQLSFQPYDAQGNAIQSRTITFGRAAPTGSETRNTADSKRDGLLVEDDAVNHSAEIMCSNELPTLRLVGSKATSSSGGFTEPVCPVIEVQDGAGNTRYAVYDDGFVVQKGHQDTDPDALNSGHFSSVLAGDGSVFIGSSRISYDRATHKLVASKLKHQIPIYLQQAQLPAASVPLALDQMTVHGWVALARTFLSNPRIEVTTVLPSANADWDAIDIDTATGGGGAASPAPTATVYCDAGYVGGNSDGSILKPYVSLVTALTAKLVEGNTTNFTFKLAAGVYTGAVSINRTTATCSFTIEGSGPDCTFVQAGTSFAAGGTSNVLFLQDFLDVTFKDFTVRYGKYGLYPRSCTSCTVSNVRFVQLGSDGQSNRHDLSGNQAEQAAFWASASTSDGGACRIRSVGQVQVQNCTVDHCARGLRIQDCGNNATVSIVSGNRVTRTLESAIYCAAGSYTGTDGCINFKISGNNINSAFNNGILLIGGQNISAVGNTVVGCASAGIQQWHGLDNVIISNSVINSNQLLHNGVGALGDAHANIHIDGSTNIRSGGKYIALVHNNTICDCNQGRAAAVYGVRIGGDVGTVSYPQESAQCSLDGNHIDAATRLHNPQSIAVVDTSDPISSNTFEIQNLSGSAELSIESNTDVAAATTKISMKAESSSATEDRLYEMQTDPSNSDQFMIRCTTNQNGTKEGWRFAPDGKVSFACGLNPITNMNASDFQVRGSSWFRSTLKSSGAIDASGGITIPSGQTVSLNGVDQIARISALEAAGGHTEFFKFFPDDFTDHEDSGEIKNAFVLPDGYKRYKIIYGDGTQAWTTNVEGLRIRLPIGVTEDGTQVELHTNHNFNHTGSYHVIFITWNSYYPDNCPDGLPVGTPTEPTTRRIVDHDVPRTIAYADGLAGELKVETFTDGSGRGVVTYTYIASEDMWIHERGSY